jgi:intracellular sulfur oxidation DsrE/DsrF family protein
MNSLDVSRRAFVVAAATVAAAAAPAVAAAADGAAGPAPAASAATAPPAMPPGFDDAVPFVFDRIAFAALLNRPAAHRQVLATKSFADARDSLNLMRNSIEAYTDPRYFAAGPNAMHAAAVFYHGSSPLLAVDDAMFAKYPLARGLITFAGTAKPGIEKEAKTNPGATAMAELVAHHGVSFFVCNNALSGISAWIAMQVTPAGSPATRAQVVAIHDELVQHFLPGAVLVPAGVAAINAAQEAHFTFLPG